MKKLIALVFVFSIFFYEQAHSGSVPAAVCGNGEATGNTHCITGGSISSIPMPGFSSGVISLTLIVLSGVIAWKINKKE
ncbi:hypothetical protein [Oceanospirillum sediminis]|uniref:IPTL-CTERM protein sorting domain-containing protein n=1 Tax=Oceanospirillum sediminis TaxID=2760088 RepID=A0A839IVU1_9GAMM|nr:hypothetical protein [Oceanospirillum sediminis]MBB1489091.1 hypothetical protein [Oceanospirillum sediminis]